MPLGTGRPAGLPTGAAGKTYPPLLDQLWITDFLLPFRFAGKPQLSSETLPAEGESTFRAFVDAAAPSVYIIFIFQTLCLCQQSRSYLFLFAAAVSLITL